MADNTDTLILWPTSDSRRTFTHVVLGNNFYLISYIMIPILNTRAGSCSRY